MLKRLLIVDDHEVVRRGIKDLLEVEEEFDAHYVADVGMRSLAQIGVDLHAMPAVARGNKLTRPHIERVPRRSIHVCRHGRENGERRKQHNSDPFHDGTLIFPALVCRGCDGTQQWTK